jgi:DMSO/TMAO reductase YedYZ molybdopterin-dependent catalytic subunit
MVLRLIQSALLAAGLLLAPASSLLAAEAPPPSPPTGDVLVTVTGETGSPLRLTAADLAKLPRRTVHVADHGKNATFEGTPLADVLKLVGAPLGENLRKDKLLLVLVVDARDGYHAAFSLPEIDPEFTDREILLADKKDQKPLSAEEGPLRVVVPGEKKGARWVRQVSALRIERASVPKEQPKDQKQP